MNPSDSGLLSLTVVIYIIFKFVTFLLSGDPGGLKASSHKAGVDFCG